MFFLIQNWNGFLQGWNAEPYTARATEEVMMFPIWVFLIGLGIPVLNY